MYDTLREMGITNFDDIERYSLRQEGDEDILKIHFRRKQGAMFAHSLKFRHGRSKKMILIDSGRHEYKEVSEISPVMLKLCSELDKVVAQEENRADIKLRILSDIDHLETVIKRKLEQIREKVSDLE